MAAVAHPGHAAECRGHRKGDADLRPTGEGKEVLLMLTKISSGEPCVRRLAVCCM